MSHTAKKRNYIIEVKLIGHQSRRALLNQLMKYRKYGSYIKKIFVVLIAEEERFLPRNFELITVLIEKLEGQTDVEVRIKPPISLKYA